MTSTIPYLDQPIFELTAEFQHALRDFTYKRACNYLASEEELEYFVTQSSLLTTTLPADLIEALLRFRRYGNEEGVVVIRGLPIDEQKIGATPTHWSLNAQSKQSYETEMYLIGCASLLGEIFTFSSQYDGSLIQNLVPMPAHANEQLGTGSKVFLDWHTEDAFHSLRADFVGLLCLRSDPTAATTFASIKRMRLPDRYKTLLFEDNFHIGIDKAHGGSGNPDEASCVSVLFGRYDDPYLRLDPSYMKARSDKPEAQEALDYIISEIPLAARQFVLQQGDLLFFDNYRIVHGRTAFQPRFDGTDRWLQRANISANFRSVYPACTKRRRVIEIDQQSIS